MNKIGNFIEEKVAPIAGKLSNQKYLKTLQNTFLSLVPFFTVGSFALVLTEPPVDYTTLDAGVLKSFMYGWQMLANYIGPVLNYVYNITMPLMALYVALGLGYNLCKIYKINSMMPILITVSTFIISACMNSEGTLTFQYFDATGLFTAIFVSIIAFEVYRFLNEKQVGRINLEGGGVPPALADSIGNLVPVVIVLIVTALLNYALLFLSSINLPQLISTVMNPFVSVVDNVWGIIILAVIVMIF